MSHKVSLVILATTLVFISFPAHAATGENKNPYVREGSIGQTSTPSTKTAKPFTTIRLRDWVGNKVIFLPRSKSLQPFGYQMWRPAGISMEEQALSGQMSIPYHVLAGKTAQVVSVDTSKGSSRKITVRLIDGTEYICENIYEDVVPEVTLLNDLAEARRRFREKPLWILDGAILTLNAQSGKIGAVEVPRTSKVHVVDVVASDTESCPIRFIVRSRSGREGYVDVHISNTNVSDLFHQYDRFSDTFLTEDPRKTRKWSSRVWSAIEKGHVLVGMSIEQVKFAWGAPKSINRTTTRSHSTEQWVYGPGAYLYLRSGIVTAIQD